MFFVYNQMVKCVESLQYPFSVFTISWRFQNVYFVKVLANFVDRLFSPIAILLCLQEEVLMILLLVFSRW
jgi:hypothetical protein